MVKSFRQYVNEDWRDWLPKLDNPFKRNSPKGSYRDKANKAVTNQRAQWTKKQGKLPPISGEIKAKSGAPTQTAKAAAAPSTEIKAKSGAPTQTARPVGPPGTSKPSYTSDPLKVRPLKPSGPPDIKTAAPNYDKGTAPSPDRKPLVGPSTAKAAEVPPAQQAPAQPTIINKGAADAKPTAPPAPAAKPPAPSTTKAAAPAKAPSRPNVATAAGPARALARPRAPVAQPKRSFGYGSSGAGHAPTRTASKGMNAGQITNRALGGVFEEKESFESFVRNKFLKENHE